MLMRDLTYAQSIREAHAELLRSDTRVFLIGPGLWSPWYAGSSLLNLDVEFGKDRVIDTPLSENAVTGAAIGAALSGLRPIVFHARMDFVILAADPIINQAANWSYLFSGQSGVPIVIRAVINRGGQQGAQHSQALHAMFMHIPGLKVVMPATPKDAKGLLISAVHDGNPVLYIDDRWLYEDREDVPEGLFTVPLGKGICRRKGSDITIVGSSFMAREAVKAADLLSEQGIDSEVIDLRTVKPWDQSLVLESVAKTGRLLVTDSGWRTCGAASEIMATVGEEAFQSLKAPMARLTLPDAPAPSSPGQERVYYGGAQQIAQMAYRITSGTYSEALA